MPYFTESDLLVDEFWVIHVVSTLPIRALLLPELDGFYSLD